MNVTDFAKECLANEVQSLKLSAAQRLLNYSISLNYEISQIFSILDEDCRINKDLVQAQIGQCFYFITNTIMFLKSDPQNLFDESNTINFHKKNSLLFKLTHKSLVGFRETIIRHQIQKDLNYALISSAVNLNLIKESRGSNLDEIQYTDQLLNILSSLNSILNILEINNIDLILDNVIKKK